MCVIIYVPQESSISRNEMLNAWLTNPDGAGFAIQKDNAVEFERGFMDFNGFYERVKPLIGKYNLLLHFRISTSKAVNAVQTHPYKKGNVTLIKGTTKKPVICMNGIISGQKEYQHCNDTMSYIIDHEEAFGVVNQDVINIIESDTGAKWAVMTPDKVLLSSKFEEEEGKWYSNQNHLFRVFYSYSPKKGKKQKRHEDFINPRVKDELFKDWETYQDVYDYIDFNCMYDDYCDCEGCLKNCKSIDEISKFLNKNYYFEPSYTGDYCCSTEDEWYICNSLPYRGDK